MGMGCRPRRGGAPAMSCGTSRSGGMPVPSAGACFRHDVDHHGGEGHGEKGTGEARERSAGGDRQEDDDGVDPQHLPEDQRSEQVVVELLHDERDAGHDEGRRGTGGGKGDGDRHHAGHDRADQGHEGRGEGDDHHRSDEAPSGQPQRGADDDRLDRPEQRRAAQVPAERRPTPSGEPPGEVAAIGREPSQREGGELVAVLEEEERQHQGEEGAGDELEHQHRALAPPGRSTS